MAQKVPDLPSKVHGARRGLAERSPDRGLSCVHRCAQVWVQDLELYLEGLTDYISGGAFNRLQVRAINTTPSRTVSPPNPAVMMLPCAHKLQERVNPSIFDLRMLTKHLKRCRCDGWRRRNMVAKLVDRAGAGLDGAPFC